MIQEVKIQGLSHSPSDYEAQDGELGTCLNLLNEDGALKPISKPEVTESFTLQNDTCSIKYVHKATHGNSTHSHYIVNCANGLPYSWYWTEKGGDGTQHELNLGDFNVNAVTAIGNIVCFVGDESTKYAFWKNNSYNVFDETLFQYDIVITDDLSPDTTDKYYSVSCNFSEDWDSIWADNGHFSNTSGKAKNPTASQIVFSGIDAMINKAIEGTDQYTFKYLSLGVVALKLYDGTYRNISSPFVIAPAFISNKFIWRDEKKVIGTYFNKHKHKITVKTKIPEELKELIIGADVFLSQPESFLNTEEAFHTINNSANFLYKDGMEKDVYSFAMNFKNKNDVYSTIDNMSFYKSIEIERDDFGKPQQLKRILETNQTISLADFMKKSFGGKVAYTYNNRLHIGNVKTTNSNSYSTLLEEEFSIKTYSENKTNMFETYLNNRLNVDADKGNKAATCDAVIAVTISENSIDKVIYEEIKINYPIIPILSYPDSRATKMVLYLPNVFKGGYMKKTMLLHQSVTMGMSYYVNLGKNRKTETAWGNGSDWENNFGTRTDETTKATSSPIDKTMLLPDDYNLPSFMNILYSRLKDYTYNSGSFGGQGSGTSVTIQKWNDVTKIQTNTFEDCTEEEYKEALGMAKTKTSPIANSSLIKVSEAENPLVFPAKNSVQVGSSVIKALVANTRPISEGQFGDAPLYAFTDEGVWVLMLGSEGTYMARQPVNRDICTNVDGILQIDDAVLYPTERGIILQQGSNSTCISDSLDGFPFDFTRMPSASKVLEVGGISSSYIKYTRFRNFLEGSNMIYDYYDNRIIVFNPSYSYAYVYSLKSKTWGTMESNFTKRVNIYPESYAINSENQIVNVYAKNPFGDVPYFLCSRPITLSGNEVYKTMFSCIVRGYFRNATSGKCGMVLYGSNDLFNWFPIQTSVDKYLRGMAGSPYKYFRIAIIGSLSVDESISGLSTEFQERWQNKLR